MNNSDRRIAFRCPECGKTIIAPLNLFSLSGEPLKLSCECGEYTLVMQVTDDRKIEVSVPCLACPKNHIYKLSSQLVFNRELFVLQCAYSGLDICFIGEKDKVDDALSKSEKELMALIDYMEQHSDEFEDADELDEELEKLIERSEPFGKEELDGDVECDDYDDFGDDLSDLEDFLQYMKELHGSEDGHDCEHDGCDCGHRDCGCESGDCDCGHDGGES